MQILGQIFAVTRMSLFTLPQRGASSMVVVVGIAGVVGVLVALLAMRDGFQKTLGATGREDEVIVLRGGSNSEISSQLSREEIRLVAQAPGILRGAGGLPLASAEAVVIANIPKKATGTDANVQIRGVGSQAFSLRDTFRLLMGRQFTAGKRELIVGQGAQRQFSGLDPGNQISLNNEPWKIVGIFATDDAHDSEIWGDVESVQATYRRAVFQSVRLKLTDPGVLPLLTTALAGDPRLRVDVQTTRLYYATQSERLRDLINFLAATVSVIMGIGATFGALNTMYAAVANRGREIAILRAIGFRAFPIVISVLLEGLLLAGVGGLCGVAVSWLMFDQYTVSTLGANFSQVVFSISISWPLVLTALRWALLIGFVGALFPAVAAARRPLTTALRTV